MQPGRRRRSHSCVVAFFHFRMTPCLSTESPNMIRRIALLLHVRSVPRAPWAPTRFDRYGSRRMVRQPSEAAKSFCWPHWTFFAQLADRARTAVAPVAGKSPTASWLCSGKFSKIVCLPLRLKPAGSRRQRNIRLYSITPGGQFQQFSFCSRLTP